LSWLLSPLQAKVAKLRAKQTNLIDYRVNVFVNPVEVFGRGTVRVVPPVADQDFLVKDGPFGAHKAILPPVKVTVVVDLKRKGVKFSPWLVRKGSY
jgi:hypothetical protein